MKKNKEDKEDKKQQGCQGYLGLRKNNQRIRFHAFVYVVYFQEIKQEDSFFEYIVSQGFKC